MTPCSSAWCASSRPRAYACAACTRWRPISWPAPAELAGVAIEAGAVLILDRDEATRIADASGCAIHGLEADLLPGVPRREATTGRRSATGRVIGRCRPSRRDIADIETGLAAVAALAPF